MVHKCLSINILLYSPFQKMMALYSFLLQSTDEVCRQPTHLNKIQYLPKRLRSRQKTFNVTALIHKYKSVSEYLKKLNIRIHTRKCCRQEHWLFQEYMDFRFCLEESILARLPAGGALNQLMRNWFWAQRLLKNKILPFSDIWILNTYSGNEKPTPCIAHTRHTHRGGGEYLS